MNFFSALLSAIFGGWLLAMSAHLLRFENREYARCVFAFIVFLALVAGLQQPLTRLPELAQGLIAFVLLWMCTMLVLRPPMWKGIAAAGTLTLVPQLFGLSALVAVRGSLG